APGFRPPDRQRRKDQLLRLPLRVARRPGRATARNRGSRTHSKAGEYSMVPPSLLDRGSVLNSRVRLGIDNLIADPSPIAGKRIGVITDPTGVHAARAPSGKPLI